MSIFILGGNNIVMNNDFTMDVLLSALYAERRRLKRGDLTEEERQRVIDEVNERLENGENPLAMMDDYAGRWKENRY